MKEIQHPHRNWSESFHTFTDPRVITMLFLGFSAGIPILLIFSSLSLWLGEAGVEKSAVTFFSWAALAYSFKFVWAPLVDRLPLPFLTNFLGRRRAWMLVAQIFIMIAIVWMGTIDPASSENSLILMALAAVLLGFSSATQDIVIDAYRIESAPTDLQAMMSATYISGYRIGMLLAGAGALVLASYFGSEEGAYQYQAWKLTYFIMASSMLIGVVTTLMISEPEQNKQNMTQRSTGDYIGFLLMFLFAIGGFVATFFISSDFVTYLKEKMFASSFSAFIIETLRFFIAVFMAIIIAKIIIMLKIVNQSMVKETYIAPVQDFFQRYGLQFAVLLLALIGLYRISDIVLGVIANIFYQDMGFTKVEIATVVKTFGLFMTIAGGFLGGLLCVRYSIIKILFLGAVLTVVTNLLFMILAQVGHDITLLYIVISADNISAGLAGAAFIAFLSSLTNVSFTAIQYAIFSSFMTLIPKIIGGYSGTIVESLGYTNFFLIASLMGVPVLLLVWWAEKFFKLKENNQL